MVRVKEGLANPAALGRPPRDLLEVMAALAAGSPANATLRALSRTAVKPLTDDELKRQASRAAHAFLSLFRTPEAEGLLRNVYRPEVPGGSEEYWRRVLAYSLEGRAFRRAGRILLRRHRSHRCGEQYGLPRQRALPDAATCYGLVESLRMGNARGPGCGNTLSRCTSILRVAT